MELLYATPDGYRVSALETFEEIDSLIGLFEQVAQEENWQPNGQLRAFVQNAVYFRLDVNGELAGGLQLVRPSATGRLPRHAVWPELPAAEPQDAHIVMLALRKEFRGSQALFWLLCAEMWRYCYRQGIRRVSLEVTPATLKAYLRFGWRLEVVGPARVHWGEPCVPCCLDVCAAAGEVARRSQGSSCYAEVLRQLFRAEDPGECVLTASPS